MNAHSFFTRGTVINQPQTPLSLDMVRHYAPSAFAVEPHVSRSARYTYIPTSEIITGLMREGFQPFKATQSRSRIEGKSEFTKHMIRFRHMSAQFSGLKVGDSVPEVVIVNSHDGTSAYKLMAALWRLVCSNGLMTSETEFGSVTVHHKGNILHQVIEGSFRVIENAQKALEVSQGWNALQLTAGEQQAFAAAAHHLRFADAEGKVATPITPAQLLSPRRREDRTQDWNSPAPDLWRTLNVVQENVIKGGLHAVQHGVDERGRRTRRNITTRQVNGIDQDVKLNRALWVLAERMAELKGTAAA